MSCFEQFVHGDLMDLVENKEGYNPKLPSLLCELPDDLLQHIMTFLPLRDAGLTFCMVCRKFSELGKDNDYWRNQCMERYGAEVATGNWALDNHKQLFFSLAHLSKLRGLWRGRVSPYDELMICRMVPGEGVFQGATVWPVFEDENGGVHTGGPALKEKLVFTVTPHSNNMPVIRRGSFDGSSSTDGSSQESPESSPELVRLRTSSCGSSSTTGRSRRRWTEVHWDVKVLPTGLAYPHNYRHSSLPIKSDSEEEGKEGGHMRVFNENKFRISFGPHEPVEREEDHEEAQRLRADRDEQPSLMRNSMVDFLMMLLSNVSSGNVLMGDQDVTQQEKRVYERILLPKNIPEEMTPHTAFLNGLWTAQYGAHGAEILKVYHHGGAVGPSESTASSSSDEESDEVYLVGCKVTGDPNIPAGKVSFSVNIAQGVDMSCRNKEVALEDGTRRIVAGKLSGKGQIADTGFRMPMWIDVSLYLFQAEGGTEQSGGVANDKFGVNFEELPGGVLGFCRLDI